MQHEPVLLTVILETSANLDKESDTYRRLLAARLRWGSHYRIQILDREVTTTDIKRLCEQSDSKYFVVVNQAHQISREFLTTLIKHLDKHTIYLADPFKYIGAIPAKPSNTKLDRKYHYGLGPDLHGIAFNTARMADLLDAAPDLDRTSINLAYRLYWNLGNITPLSVGYSISSDTNAAIGYKTSEPTKRILPLIATSSVAMKARILRMLVLYLRGLRETRETSVPLDHLHDIAKTFSLGDHIDLAQHMHPFEAAWINWLIDPDSGDQKFKQLTNNDVDLVFTRLGPDAAGAQKTYNPHKANNSATHSTSSPGIRKEVLLQSITFDTETLHISKRYKERAPESSSPEIYDYYSNSIDEDSIFLFFDRPLQADDNAEYLYSYFVSNYPEYKRAYFALNPKSPDWPRLEGKGFKLIPMFSKDFYELYLRSDVVISSQIFNLRYKGKSFSNSRFVYLQHGVQLNDMSNWVASKHFDLFIATGRLEADYLEKVAPLETLNSGLPRLQTLEASPQTERTILFMPTWRSTLNQASPDGFRSSQYFQSINSLITEPRLLSHLEATNTTLKVKLHPNVEKRAHHFDFSNTVQKSTDSYRAAISSSTFVFTDYSSAVLDAAFIHIPIAYYQWDRTDFFKGQLYQSRLDYTSHGLGPVFYRQDELIEYLISNSHQEMDERYLARRNEFFEGVDVSRINESIIERMLNL
ncbi:CDP-glycerol glycerophosphotransferase family protein [Brevibacterium antiquum]|uniref:CDP-glycerol glycerophosphotransferase, TagB/SpsB family n=1 Tax=Brevibacterium antiquum TaxID=234835 RepID=A0A2H1KMJ5_9MICO|nr:CDP-glycerol glycerophosphotransferase family protein [Brevibacterium antiquum]SMY01035.1 CDP-glycerol glycerophosphotransferase, TagB/SpsB family [Brevibacterium antiquum]